jgi:hypothetical protein
MESKGLLADMRAVPQFHLLWISFLHH